jgi:hypothetical protein
MPLVVGDLADVPNGLRRCNRQHPREYHNRWDTEPNLDHN